MYENYRTHYTTLIYKPYFHITYSIIKLLPQIIYIHLNLFLVTFQQVNGPKNKEKKSATDGPLQHLDSTFSL